MYITFAAHKQSMLHDQISKMRHLWSGLNPLSLFKIHAIFDFFNNSNSLHNMWKISGRRCDYWDERGSEKRYKYHVYCSHLEDILASHIIHVDED